MTPSIEYANLMSQGLYWQPWILDTQYSVTLLYACDKLTTCGGAHCPNDILFVILEMSDTIFIYTYI